MKKVFTCFTILSALVVLVLFNQSCQNNSKAKASPYDSLILKKDLVSPELTPEESMKKMHLEDGFTVQLVASEPLVIAPVVLTFDDKGRIWVVEMQDYMPDTLGTGENEPIGKVVILSDKNGDGVMDDRKVFLDSLVLPRAISFVENGILVAEPPYLNYYTIENDKPVNKVLVDSTYADGGNVEHQPNGLLRAMDNWIYSAKSAKRYRKKGNKWLIERTHFRGQWGISQDDEGRLFYNTNSENLLGDYFLPGLGAYNEHQRNVEGFNKKIVNNNRVYPAHLTPGVNRGYMEGVLDDSLRLKNFTAACGPVIYNGQAFGKEYYGNAFVAEPSANLIKRNIIREAGFKVTGEEAYDNKEFLASEDERFRPVNLHVGLDGALYVVDFYRGIIQHKTYLTPYLKNEIRQRNITRPLSAGRIYKIVPTKSTEKAPVITNEPNALLQLLQHSNGVVRNKAQQMIVDQKMVELVPSLRSNLADSANALKVFHSLWTLEGLNALQPADVLPFLNSTRFNFKRQALSLIPSILNSKNANQFIPILNTLLHTDSLAAPYVGYLVHYIKPLNNKVAQNMMLELTKAYPSNIYVADAIISNLQGAEATYAKTVLSVHPDTSLAINKRFKKVLGDMEKEKNNRNNKEIAKAFPMGAKIFGSVCQTCHGADANGVSGLAPPLNQSNWVTGDKNKLIPIVLYGLSGPIKVGEKLYKSPEISGEMPGIGQNKEFSDEDIAQLLSYIRNAWSNKAEKISPADINKARTKFSGREKAFTAEELNKLK